MDWNNKIRAARLGYILISIALCVLGIISIAVPTLSAVLICRISGILMILFGIIKILGYCSRDLYRLAFQHDLASGILLLALGTVMLVRTKPMVYALCTVMGIYVLGDALLKIQIAIDSKVFGLRKWWLILSAAILTGVVGFLLIFRPSESTHILMTLFGLSLLTEGILNMVTILTAVKIIRNTKPEVIDAEDYEVLE